MKQSFVALAALLVLGLGAARLLHAEGELSPSATRWEYRHLLIPLDRDLVNYPKSDEKLLAPLARLGEEGWELVSANEPANGVLVHGRATVEFFLKRPIR